MDFSINLLDRLLTGSAGIKDMLERLPFDLLLLTESFSHPLTAPLWFLSAMFLVFPFVCVLSQSKNEYFVILVSLIFPVYYYGYTNYQMIRDVPFDMLRILADMFIGILIYEINDYFINCYFNRLVISLIEIFCFLVVFINAFIGLEAVKGTIICFSVQIAIMTSGKSVTTRIKIPILSFLGKISMPIYICHWFVGSVLWFVYSRLQVSRVEIYFFYYVGTVVVSLLLYWMINKKMATFYIFRYNHDNNN